MCGIEFEKDKCSVEFKRKEISFLTIGIKLVIRLFGAQTC